MSINWTDTSLPIVHHDIITEWDIKSANTSLMKYYQLAKEKDIDYLKSLSKDKREKAVGMMCLKDKEFSDNLEKSFTRIISEFFQANGLQKEDCISIKKDAVFVRSKLINHFQFGDSVTFVKKNEYTGFACIPGYEFYYNDKTKKFDVKGINDISLELHKDGILDFVSEIFHYIRNESDLNEYLHAYVSAYKNRELIFDNYRQFNSDSNFLVRMAGAEVYMESITESMMDSVDISFNYINVIIPLIKLALN